MMLTGKLAQCPSRPAAGGAARRTSTVTGASRRVVAAPQQRLSRATLKTRSAEEGGAPAPEGEQAAAPVMEEASVLRSDERGPRRFGPQQDTPEFAHFLPLPKPAHLIYIKPTVAVVADVAARNSVGLKMSAGDDKLERYIIEFYSKSVK
ncbi:hypothetical protein DUNSADRAFT_2006 [Dunaliella salina]|uniref:Uncharacterized protein n=1 Tax=Dunaliella salina TaxID=3046 RepID=A0ABQ7GWE7_DUNSA|nr:hypothetical protein DUNSADRAFT_2006 [Dunaliella salina]|eukprot:KAF5838915.1 hypothetical protein DUNSADRAFT_2006 [Dunaliella salina]